MKFTVIVDAFVIGFLCVAVLLGACGASGCAPIEIYGGVEDGPDVETGKDRDAPPDVREDVQEPESAADAGEPDSGRESGGADSWAAIETGPGVDSSADVLPTFEHRLATGELYRSPTPQGDPVKSSSWTPALFAEQIEEVEKRHPGDWRGPYPATCDLKSEGHGLESCQYVEMTGKGVMLCPFGISYVAAAPSCPPLASTVSWW